MTAQYLANLAHFVPELIATLTMVGILFLEASYKNDERDKRYVFATAILGLVVVILSVIASLTFPATTFFSNSLIHDSFGAFAKILMSFGTLVAVYMSTRSSEIYDEFKSEFAAIAIGVLIGGMLLVSANNMLTLYLGVETLSILSYVMAAMKKRDEKSSEAGLKYVLYGGVAAGVMLFGMAHLFGSFGTIQFSEMRPLLAKMEGVQLAVVTVSFLLFFVGVGYKIACVPFHMWSPDVYEGSPTPVTVFFAVVPKMAGIVALVRLTGLLTTGPEILKHSWLATLSLISALTMTVGNVSAIGQRSVKRMLAFSSISHVGMIMMGVIVLSEVGLRSVLFYLFAYLFMTLTAFFIITIVADHDGNDHFERFSGLVYRHPLMAILLSVVMFSLAGLPPLSGFVAKFNIFSVVIEKKYYSLALIAAINSVVAVYYYLKVIRLMVFKEAETSERIPGFTFFNQSLILLMAIPVLVLGIFWERILFWAQGAKLFVP